MAQQAELARAAPATGAEPGVIHVDRSVFGVVVKVARNPMTAVPAEAYSERMVVTRNLGTTRAYVTDPALIHEAVVRNADRLEKSGDMKRVLGTALGEGLLTADGQAWRWQRQAIAPAFQHEKLQALLGSMIAAAEATRDRWMAMPPGATVDLGHEMMVTTFEIILDTMLSGPEGMDVARIEKGVADFLGATPWMFVMAILGAPRWLPFPGRGPAMAATRLMRGTVLERIAERRAARHRRRRPPRPAARRARSRDRPRPRRRADRRQHPDLYRRRPRDNGGRARLDVHVPRAEPRLRRPPAG